MTNEETKKTKRNIQTSKPDQLNLVLQLSFFLSTRNQTDFDFGPSVRVRHHESERPSPAPSFYISIVLQSLILSISTLFLLLQVL